MKKFCKTIFRFLGSMPFALFLIGMSALFVIAGTLLESMTESHRYAAVMTYSHVFFIGLLWGFFINILFSALRRYPFKKKHIPFLITHWGLLMILGGLLIKSYYGKQGSMAIIEGTASQEIFLADSHAILIESRIANEIGEKRAFVDLEKQSWQNKSIQTPFPALKMNILGWAPHCREHLELTAGRGHLYGSEPFFIPGFAVDDKGTPIATRLTMPGNEKHIWKIVALRSNDPLAQARQLYIDGTNVIVSETHSGAILWQGPLKQLLAGQPAADQGSIQAELQFSWQHPQINVTYNGPKGQNLISILLQGSEALLSSSTKSFLGAGLLAIDLTTEPAIYLLQNGADLTAAAFDPYGQVIVNEVPQSALESIVVYDEGYQGYALPIELTAPAISKSRRQRQLDKLELLAQPLRQAEKRIDDLAPPLHLLYQTCLQVNCDFTETLTSFLSHWHNVNGWLYPENISLPILLETVFKAIDWSLAPEIYTGCVWNSTFFARLEPMLLEANGSSFVDILKSSQWPLPLDPEASEEQLMKTITCQLFAASRMLPIPQESKSGSNARLFSAFLRAYDLHLSSLLAGINENEASETISLECPLTSKQVPCEPLQKLEDNIPRLLVRFEEGKQQQTISLSYDKFGTGLKWPIMEGKYLVRLQPLFVALPYSLRLRQARQINYAGSGQPYSYESDLLIKELASGQEVEKTISMNEVHETWDGYRFYLANIVPPDPGALKRVQIVANRDPAKYFLTYAGAFIMTLGIVLLFWWQPYKK